MDKTLEYYLSLDYPVETRKIDENLGGGYIASIPCLGAQAFVGDGDTPQEAYENLMAAKAEIFADYLRNNLPISEPPSTSEYEDYSGKLVLRMPRELHARLAWAAKANDVSLNQFLVYALSSFEAKRASADDVKTAWSDRLNGNWTGTQPTFIDCDKKDSRRFANWSRGTNCYENAA